MTYKEAMEKRIWFIASPSLIMEYDFIDRVHGLFVIMYRYNAKSKYLTRFSYSHSTKKLLKDHLAVKVYSTKVKKDIHREVVAAVVEGRYYDRIVEEGW